jgi:hypothetical protein
MSIAALAKTRPVKPPTVNRNTNPIAQRIGVSNFKGDPCIVANHLNTLIPVGTAITIVAAVK